MKKFLCIIALSFISIASFGQVAEGTVTNTTYAYATQTLNSGVGGKVAYQIVATRTSGTTTGGVQLQYSNDGVTYIAIPSTDTLAIANVATPQSKFQIIDIPAAKYVRMRAQLAGTGVYTFKLFANYRYSAKP